MCDISFIILTWNSEQTIDSCLESVAQFCTVDSLDYEILVVDNGSNDSTVSRIEAYLGKIPVRLLKLSRNQGTTCTRNQAIRKATGKYLCILDSDASFREGSLKDVISVLESDPTIGILAPRMIVPSGQVQVSVKKFPTLTGKLARIPRILLRMNLVEYGIYDGFPFDTQVDVDTAISASWFLRRELIDEIGFLDEHIFYAPEDIDYCMRLRCNGRRIVYYPQFTVLHRTQQITHKRVFSHIALSHLYGLIYYFIKHRYIFAPRIPTARK